jgi:hypothetical protein
VSLVGRIPAQDHQLRHVQELQRRDETKLPDAGGMPITRYAAFTDADLFNSGGDGWFINDPLVVTAQGNTAHMWGSVIWTGAFTPYAYLSTNVLRPGAIPAAFLPDGSRRFLRTSGGVETPEVLFSLAMLVTGQIDLFTFHSTASAPWAHVALNASSPTPVLSLELTYPLVT